MSRCRTWRTTAPRPEATHVTSHDSSRPHAHLCPTLKASHAVATWRGRGGGCVRRKGRRRQPQRHGAPRMRLLRDDSWARDDRTQASRPTPAPPHVRGAGHTQQPRPRCGILATSAQLVQRKRKLRSTTKKAMHVQAGGDGRWKIRWASRQRPRRARQAETCGVRPAWALHSVSVTPRATRGPAWTSLGCQRCGRAQRVRTVPRGVWHRGRRAGRRPRAEAAQRARQARAQPYLVLRPFLRVAARFSYSGSRELASAALETTRMLPKHTPACAATSV